MLASRADVMLWARQLDVGPRVKRAPRPAPAPPISARPRSLSVTEVETWIRDPYAIYAKHVLHLKPAQCNRTGGRTSRTRQRHPPRTGAIPERVPGHSFPATGWMSYCASESRPLWRWAQAPRHSLCGCRDLSAPPVGSCTTSRIGGERISHSFVEVKGSLSLKSATAV